MNFRTVLAPIALFFPLVLTLTAAPAVAQRFVPNEQLVSPQKDLIDAEYNQARMEFVWTDSSGSLWIGKVDPVTGAFQPRNGKGTLVDGDAQSTADLYVTLNGPEWVPAADGDYIVYTKFVPDYPHVAASARLALAKQAPDGSWSARTLGPNLPRIGPYASMDAGDPEPRITYIDDLSNHYWRNVSSAKSEELIPGLPPSVKSVRFVGGQRALVYSTAVDGLEQVFTYDLELKTLQQITFDAGNKDLQTVPWMWQAPEYGGATVLMTVVENTLLRFYRAIDDGRGTPVWTAFHEVAMPAGSKISSPEPFVFDGASYVSLTLNVGTEEFPSTIWIVGVNPSRPLLRQVNDATLVRARIDPEVVITTRGVYVYYNRFNPEINPDKPYCAECSEGVFRAFTGLRAR